jgi:dipeptidyl aminopeptidase/acylaminoacyl peptidase
VAERKRLDAEPENFLVAVPLAGGPIHVLAKGADFYASPRLSPDGQRLAYLAWNHPNMPWDGCRLHLCDLEPSGYPANDQVVAGGEAECIFQPHFSPTGVLHFISDRSGFGNLYRREDDGATTCLWPLEADFHQPQWVFGQSTYAFHDGQTIVCSYFHDGQPRLGVIRNGAAPSLSPIPLTDIPALVGDGAGNTYCLGAAHHLPPALYAFDPRAGTIVHQHGPKVAPLPPKAITRGRAIRFPTTDDQVAHGFFYPPENPNYQAVEGERPPLMVICHGGPTGAASTAFSLAIHFWTTRGFAVLDVNYRGSTGFGRAYMDALAGQWGVLDVEDCVAGARFLVAAGDVDPNRLVIRGGSAGGLTVLSALAHHRVFRAGASYYGVCDLESLAKDTHKFESRYLDRLIGPYPAKDATYRERSPLSHADKIDVPVIFFHGKKDPVVPLDQAERMAKALATRGVPAPMQTFPDESHGFRSAATIATALQAELDFYLGVFSGGIAKKTG